MLEPLVRNNLHRLHTVYDRVPSPARNLLASARGVLLARIRYSGAALNMLKRLRDQEGWSPGEIRQHQLARLQEMLDHARGTTAHYRKYPRLRLRSCDDLCRLPILSREVVRRDPSQFFSDSVPIRERIQAGTTGTTGANLTVAYSEQTLAENWAFLLRQWAWAGIPPRTPRLTLFGARVVPADRDRPPYWTYNIAERQLLLSIFHLSTRTAGDYLRCLSRHAGKVLEGFPSVLAILGDFAERSGRTIPMRAIFTSGEPLYPDVRERIEKVFRARIFDSYGMTELCGLVQECEAGEMHLAPEYGFLEILSDRGEPVESGEEGHFVWTGFLNAAMPLIRYRVGDRGKWRTGAPCACGRAFPRVVPTITRESDVLRAPDGRLFSPRALNQLLKQTTALRFCQFVHDRLDRVVVRGVASGASASEEVMKVRARLQQLLGTSANVTAELSDAPISRHGGKIPLIVNQVAR
ncbi:MAG: phenylacetate--CoA ligase family protein [Candidatus Acidiferrales bacterium]